VFADLIDGPLAHLPSGLFPANAAWTMLAAIAHNPAPGGRHTHRLRPRSGPWGDPAPAVGQCSGPDRTTSGQADPAPARALAPRQEWHTLWDRALTKQERQVAA
jgi:hypothetical protein